MRNKHVLVRGTCLGPVSRPSLSRVSLVLTIPGWIQLTVMLASICCINYTIKESINGTINSQGRGKKKKRMKENNKFRFSSQHLINRKIIIGLAPLISGQAPSCAER